MCANIDAHAESSMRAPPLALHALAVAGTKDGAVLEGGAAWRWPPAGRPGSRPRSSRREPRERCPVDAAAVRQNRIGVVGRRHKKSKARASPRDAAASIWDLDSWLSFTSNGPWISDGTSAGTLIASLAAGARSGLHRQWQEASAPAKGLPRSSVTRPDAS
jgi:hypothetical protein